MKTDQLSKGTIDNLFNIAMNGTPAYVDDEDNESENDELAMRPIKPTGRTTSDEATINSVKKGKKPLK
jgi:hypothetical protein